LSARNGAQRASQAVYDFVKSHRVLWTPAGWISKAVTASPESSPIRFILGPARDRLRGAMRPQVVLQIVDLLEARSVPFYLAGGWGVDALLGRQSRSHDDLDVVVDDYEQNLPGAVDALASLGFKVVDSFDRRTWMPRNTVLADDGRRVVDLDSLDWELLARMFGPPGADDGARRQFEHRVFAQGIVDGRRVPCLSADVQLLYHTSFELSPSHRHDVRLLCDELGATVSDAPSA
jgi:lincosamide nucleotidyltransferase A/C/D/E